VNYDFDVEQKLLRDSAHKFFSKECDSDLVRELVREEDGYCEKLWPKMADLGWMGLLIPETYDGEALDFMGMAVLLHEMGYACFPSPFFSTAVTGVLLLLEAGNEYQKKAILPRVAAGKQLLALAFTGEDASYDINGLSLQVERESNDFFLTGRKRLVTDAQVADTLLCMAEPQAKEAPDALDVFIVDPKSAGVHIKPLKTFTGEKLSDIEFDHVRVPESDRLGNQSLSKSAMNKLLLTAAVGKSAEMVGYGQRVMEMTLDHAKNRIQFGRPVGSFQAVQHHCADMLTYLETSRYMMYQAAWQIAEGLPFEKAASMSKAWVSDACRRLVALGHQVMGGLGFMEEIDLHLYFNRVKAAELAFGDADFHREYVARQLEK
jgi:alkylation response protein AidB-like acyl-CoA dehydrogenase